MDSAERDIPLTYIDIGRYFCSSNPILIKGDAIVKWIHSLSSTRASSAALAERLGHQLHMNGVKTAEIYFSSASSSEQTSGLMQALSQHFELVVLEPPAHDMQQWLTTKSKRTPILLTVQTLEPFEFIVNCLLAGLSVGLLSERTLVPGDRLYAFVYLAMPHLPTLLAKSGLTDSSASTLSLELKRMALSPAHVASDKETIALASRLYKVPTPLLDVVSPLLQFLHASGASHGTAFHSSLLPYIQIDADLHPIFREEEYELTERQKREARDGTKALKKLQKFYANIHFHAESLSGATHLYRHIVLGQSTPADASEKKPSLASSSSSKPSKPEKKSKAQLRKEENEKRLLDLEIAKQKRILATAVENLSVLRSVGEKLAILDNLKMNSGGASGSIPQMTVALILARMDVYVGAWKEDMLNKSSIATSTEDSDFLHAVAVFEQIFALYDDYLSVLTAEQVELNVLPAILMFGFTEAAGLFLDAYIAQSACPAPAAKKLTASLKSSTANTAKYRIKTNYTRFQLAFCGHLFPRSLDARPDPRVLFKPDLWQVELLDAVDRNESALICAPTSSGKTFICFYAMERILRTNHDDVVIYVAPNKALMNQVMADVYARFQHKQYPSGSSRRLFGKLDDREAMSAFDCQVLVTFPDAFVPFALSPLYASYWSRRVKYVILDEIHTIGEEDKGAAWEKIIGLAQCPILALSATIGNKEKFWSWMNRVQSVLHIPCRLIQVSERFSDLKKYVYQPDLTRQIDLENFDSIKPRPKRGDATTPSRILELHPLNSVSEPELSHPLPEDYHFLSSDTLRLVEALGPLISEPGLKERLALLDPELYFRNVFRITKKDTRAYEKKVKDFLRDMSTQATLGPALSTLLSRLGSKTMAAFGSIEAALQEQGSEAYITQTLLPLLMDLSAESKLPVILFNFDRSICTRLAVGLNAALDLAEAHKRRRQSKDLKARQSEMERMAKSAKRQRDAEKKVTKDSWIEDSIQEESLADLTSALDRFDTDLTFHDPRYKLRESDLTEMIEKKRLTRHMTSPTEKCLLAALKRGIGVHHQGVPRAYLQLVEHLFRLRHLQVVIATSTLALGINMPCKSVVFAGDDLALTPLLYRQMSGRAGRRGYDDLGHVLFHGISKSKMDALLTSQLPTIQTNSLLNANAVLEWAHLSTATRVQPSLMTTFDVPNGPELHALLETLIKRLVKLPLSSRLSEGPEEAVRQEEKEREQRAFYLLQYLLQFGFMTLSGDEPNMAVPSLYARLPLMIPYQPLCFILMSLFQSGCIERMTAEWQNAPEKVSRSLVALLANLFQPRYLLSNDKSAAITLEPLDAAIRDEIVSIQSRTLSLASQLQGIDWTTEQQQQQQQLQFDSRNGALILDTNLEIFHAHDPIYTSFPILTLPPASSLNNYIYAYYCHTDMARIESENGLREKDCWVDFYEFNCILSQLEAWANATPQLESHTREAIQSIAAQWFKKFKKMWA